MSEPRATLELSHDAALVLFEMLARERPDTVVRARDTAEQNAMWELEAALERRLTEPLSPSYQSLLEGARNRLGDAGGLAAPPLVAFVDVDDTIVRSAGSKRIPMTGVIARVRELHAAGCELYCWSSGGAAYAEEAAVELKIATCFVGFLPKPQVLVDDQVPAAWRGVVVVHPNKAQGMSVAEFKAAVSGEAG